MKLRTKSILEELENLHIERDSYYVIKSRADNIIESSIRLLDLIDKTYDHTDAENLTRKLLNSIRTKDPSKFQRSIQKIKKIN
jgi:hypothetical protein